MSKLGKLVKNMVRNKKESVMGKLGDSPYSDPMEPWSGKYTAPVREDALTEAGLLQLYINAKGLDHTNMDGNQKASYSRSSEFRKFKMHHSKRLNKEEVDEADVISVDIPLMIRLLEYAREDAKTDMDLHKVTENLIGLRSHGVLNMSNYEDIVNVKSVKESKDVGEYDYEGAMAKNNLQTICRNADDLKNMLKDDENLPEWVQAKITKAEDYITTSLDYLKSTRELGEEVKQIKELSTDLLGRYKKAAGAQASAADKAGNYEKGNKRFSGIMKATRKQFDNDAKKVKETSGMGERIEELKNQNDNNEIEDRISYEETKIKNKDGKKVSNSGTKGVEEAYQSYSGPSHGHAYGGTGFKRPPREDDEYHVPDPVSKPKDVPHSVHIGGKKWKTFTSQSHASNVAKKIKGATVHKEEINEGIYGIEDSPMSATNSVKAMESSPRKKEMSKSARMIKNIYKKKGVAETTYDWEKDSKPPAKMKVGVGTADGESSARKVLTGGKTMTGQSRDTIEIDPALNYRPDNYSDEMKTKNNTKTKNNK